MQEKVKLLKNYINNLRDLRSEKIESETINEEQLYYLQEGYKEGLRTAAIMLADELDDIECSKESEHVTEEEEWWHDVMNNAARL